MLISSIPCAVIALLLLRDKSKLCHLIIDFIEDIEIDGLVRTFRMVHCSGKQSVLHTDFFFPEDIRVRPCRLRVIPQTRSDLHVRDSPGRTHQ